ncbi:hypothetical protein PWT90_05211 [Aphanocladium album]|nr:hypothetical protein PWT90_05211 [Aphanocladium album]
MEDLTQQFECGLSLQDQSGSNNSSAAVASESTKTLTETGHSIDENGRSQQSADEEERWKSFLSFMEQRAQAAPYPKYLYRAHTHGYPIPRYMDSDTGLYCDSFGSDLRNWMEHDAQCEIHVPCLDPCDRFPTEEVFEELRNHLQKTQLMHNGESYLSRMVSLSGNFRWTIHRLCEVGKFAEEDQIPGLAIFNVQKIQEQEVRIWRVKDMFGFLEQCDLKTEISIPPYVQVWAKNADEYVCWEQAPREALLSFSPLSRFVPLKGSESVLLGTNFRNSLNLQDFAQLAKEKISLDEYVARVSTFLSVIIAVDCCFFPQEAGLLLELLTQYFENSSLWGYDFAYFIEDMEDALQDCVNDLKSCLSMCEGSKLEL